MRTVVEKTSGDWIIDSHVLRVDTGLVLAYNSEAVAEAISSTVYDEYATGQDQETAWPMEGDIVNFDSVDYISRIDYNVWTPDEYPRGWKSTEAVPEGSWQPDIYVQQGEYYDYDGVRYGVRISHTTQRGWEPPRVPALFSVVLETIPGEISAWQAGIAVTVGEQYTYGGSTYEVIQSHTTQAGWEPPNVPALWLLTS